MTITIIQRFYSLWQLFSKTFWTSILAPNRVRLDSANQNVLKLFLRNPRYVQFGANHTLYGADPHIPATHWMSIERESQERTTRRRTITKTWSEICFRLWITPLCLKYPWKFNKPFLLFKINHFCWIIWSCICLLDNYGLDKKYTWD